VAIGKISTDTTHRAVPRRQLSLLYSFAARDWILLAGIRRHVSSTYFRIRLPTTTVCRSAVCIGDSDVISMPAGFRRHLVGKTLRNDFHCDIAEIV